MTLLIDESNVLLNKLLLWLKNPFEKDNEINVSPQISEFSEILQYNLTGKRDLITNTIGGYFTWTYGKHRNNNITT